MRCSAHRPSSHFSLSTWSVFPARRCYTLYISIRYDGLHPSSSHRQRRWGNQNHLTSVSSGQTSLTSVGEVGEGIRSFPGFASLSGMVGCETMEASAG